MTTIGMLIVSKARKNRMPSVTTEKLSFLKMVLSIQVSGKVIRDMVKVLRNGLMELCTRDSGKMIWLMGRGHSGTSTVTNIKDSGRETRPTAKASIPTVMEQATMVNGRMIYSMGLAQNHGTTTPNTKASTLGAKNME